MLVFHRAGFRCQQRLKATAATAILALAALSAAPPARAQETVGTPLSFTVNGGMASDYVFRGVSQTDEGFQIFGGADVTYDQLYAGVWVSNVDFGDETNAEIDIYGGWKPTYGDYSFDFGIIGYLYSNAPSGSDYNYVEFKAAGSRSWDQFSLGAAGFYSPDFFGAEDWAFYGELNASYVLPLEGLVASGAVGHQFVKSDADYWTWNAGASYTTGAVTLDVRYHDTDDDDLGNLGASRFIASIKLAF